MFKSFRYKNFKVVFYVAGFLLLLCYLSYWKTSIHENNDEQKEMSFSKIQENNLEPDLLREEYVNINIKDEETKSQGQNEASSYSDIFCKILEIFFEIIGFLLEILG